MRSSRNPSPVLAGRWSSDKILQGNVDLLCFDIFGFALSPALLDPHDIHRLVAALLRRKFAEAVPDYIEHRCRAERAALQLAAAEGRSGIALADITEQLGGQLASAIPDGASIARYAVKAEIELEQVVHAANPDAFSLYREARKADIPVAFIADSYLPRDVVTKMLSHCGYHQRAVELVSSHEGTTKTSGDLFQTLAERSRVRPERIAHLGPDAAVDVDKAKDVGLAPIQIRPARADVQPLFELNLVERTGVDSAGLALAADRLAEVAQRVTAADIGYYAAGPLLAGYAGWIGRLIDELDPHNVLFCGPSGRLLRELATILRPDLPISLFHELESPADSLPPSTRIDGMVQKLSRRDPTRVLAVDVGWMGEPHHWLPPVLSEAGTPVQLTTAYLGRPDVDAGLQDPAVRTWAFAGRDRQGLGARAADQIDVLSAMVPASNPDLRTHTAGYLSALPQIAAGARSFAEHFQQWLRLETHEASPALAEPALRILTAPTVAEAEILGQFRVDNPTGEGTVALAALPPVSDISQDPACIERASHDAAWPEGYAALIQGEELLPVTVRRRRRGLRRGLLPPRNQAS